MAPKPKEVDEREIPLDWRLAFLARNFLIRWHVAVEGDEANHHALSISPSRIPQQITNATTSPPDAVIEAATKGKQPTESIDGGRSEPERSDVSEGKEKAQPTTNATERSKDNIQQKQGIDRNHSNKGVSDKSKGKQKAQPTTNATELSEVFMQIRRGYICYSALCIVPQFQKSIHRLDDEQKRSHKSKGKQNAQPTTDAIEDFTETAKVAEALALSEIKKNGLQTTTNATEVFAEVKKTIQELIHLVREVEPQTKSIVRDQKIQILIRLVREVELQTRCKGRDHSEPEGKQKVPLRPLWNFLPSRAFPPDEDSLPLLRGRNGELVYEMYKHTKLGPARIAEIQRFPGFPRGEDPLTMKCKSKDPKNARLPWIQLGGLVSMFQKVAEDGFSDPGALFQPPHLRTDALYNDEHISYELLEVRKLSRINMRAGFWPCYCDSPPDASDSIDKDKNIKKKPNTHKRLIKRKPITRKRLVHKRKRSKDAPRKTRLLQRAFQKRVREAEKEVEYLIEKQRKVDWASMEADPHPIPRRVVDELRRTRQAKARPQNK